MGLLTHIVVSSWLANLMYSKIRLCTLHNLVNWTFVLELHCLSAWSHGNCGRSGFRLGHFLVHLEANVYIYYGVVSIECDYSSVSVVLWNFSCFFYFLYLTNSNPCNRFKFSDNLLIAMIWVVVSSLWNFYLTCFICCVPINMLAGGYLII